MTYSYTSPDGIPYPELSSKIGDTANQEDLRQLLQEQATKTQIAFTGRDGVTVRIQGSADTLNLDELVEVSQFGWYELTSFGGAYPLPPGFSNRGSLFVHGGTRYSVKQEITAREANSTWQRTCRDANATPKIWTEWSLSSPPKESSRVDLGMIGDSLVASHNLVPSLSNALPGIYCYSRGWNGETTDGLCLRMGAKDYWWTVAGGAIPASGSVVVTTAQSLQVLDGDTYYTGVLAGVAGMIEKTSSGFTFVRDVAGTSVSVTEPVKLDPTWTQTTRGHMVGILAGRNDVTNGDAGVDGSIPQHIAANTSRIIDWLSPTSKLFFLLGTINRTTEPSGSVGYEQVVEANRLLREKFPDRFIDLRGYLVNQAIYDLGITPTSEDLANMANDCPPPSVMVDPTHYTDQAATKVVEKLIVPWLKGNGYVAK